MEESKVIDCSRSVRLVSALNELLASIGSKAVEKGNVFEKGIASILCSPLYNNKPLIEGPLFKYIFKNGWAHFENEPEKLIIFERVKSWLESTQLAIKMF